MKAWLLTTLLVLSLSSALQAQSPDGPGTVSRGSYSGGDLDSINLYNGNVLFNIPVFSRPGRELSSGLNVTYNSQGWKAFVAPPYGIYFGGFQFSSPTGTAQGASIYPYLIDCDYTGYPYVPPTGTWAFDVTWTDGEGAIHGYPMSDYVNYPGYGGCDELTYLSWNDLTGQWLPASTPDDNSMAFINNGTVTIFHGDGHRITAGSNVESRNGNYEDPFGIYGDTLGRTVSVSTGGSSPNWTTTYTLHDFSGSAQDYTLHGTSCHTAYNPVTSASSCINVITSIDLPNGKSYSFEYGHDQGFLTKINLPSGGYIAYDYYGGNSDHDIDHNYILNRRVSANGTAYVTWNYERSISGTTRTVTVTDPDGHQVVHVFDGDVFETQTDWKENSSASASKTVTNTWSGGQLQTVVTQVGSVKQQQTFTWTGPIVTEITQSDWYTGSTVIPLRKTIMTPTSYGSVPTNDLLPSSVELQQWDAGSSSYVTQGRTEYVYDEYSLTSRSGSIPGHHSLLVLRRNNVTTIKRYYDATHYLDEHFYYDILGNVVEHVDERGKSTTYDFADNFSGLTGTNTFAYPTQVTDPNIQAVATTVYNFDTGLLASVTDVRSQVTTFDYDSMNRTASVSGPAGKLTSYDYNDTDLKVTESTKVATLKSRTTETTMDGLGRPLQTKLSDPGGDIYVNTEYYDAGGVKRVSEPYRSGTPVWTQTAYDVLGRRVSITNPDSSSASFSYSGNTVTRTDEAGNLRRYTSNALEQVTKVEEPNPNLSSPLVTDYSYYVFGPLHQVTQSGLTRTFTVDWLGRTTSEDHPENGSTSYTYDGRLVASRTDSLGILTDYTYDNAGRILSVQYHDGSATCVNSTPCVAYTYDASPYTGLLTSVAVDGVTSSSFTYDNAGQLLSEAVTRNGVTGTFTNSYTYDLAGRLLTVTYPSGRVLTQTYAENGSVAGDRLATLTNGPTATKILDATQDNAAGMITNRTLSSGITETRSFNTRNQIIRISAAANSTTLLDMGYGYGTTNNIGKIRARNDAVQPEHSANYTFDEIGRLKEVSGGDSSWGIAYTLDPYGNRTAQTPSGLANGPMLSQSIGYTNNKNNGYTYDNGGTGGNVAYDGTYHYYYDAENRIDEVGSSAIQYAYDEAGRRIRKIAGGVTTHYFYGLTGLMSEFSTSTSLSSASAAASSDRVQYRIGEQTGTGVMLLAGDGTARENNRVFPFGELWNSASGSDNTEKFTTYQRDGETDLDYAMARYYASRSGRFLSPDPGHAGADPSDPQSWNPYVLVSNDPVDGTDPTGLFTSSLESKKPSGGGDPAGSCYDAEKPIRCYEVQVLLGTIDVFDKVATFAKHVVVDLAPAPRDMGCMAKLALAGGSAGVATGAAVGAAGIVTGPGVALTEGGGILIGGGVGFGGGASLGWSVCMKGNGRSGGGGNGRSSPNQMQKQVERGQAPSSVDRVDSARIPFEKDHVEFKDGTALNFDGTWKHGGRALTNIEKGWLLDNGWSLPK